MSPRFWDLAGTDLTPREALEALYRLKAAVSAACPPPRRHACPGIHIGAVENLRRSVYEPASWPGLTGAVGR